VREECKKRYRVFKTRGIAMQTLNSVNCTVCEGSKPSLILVAEE